jgi:DNA (cytosine-5)-methyltransferase 1
MLRIIQAVRPTWVIGENVAGHITLGLDTVLSDLEGEGYQARCFVIPAVAADAPHRRDRCWIVGHSKDIGRHRGSATIGRKGQAHQQEQPQSEIWGQSCGSSAGMADTDSERLEGGVWQGFEGRGERPSIRSWWEPEPTVGRVANGVPGRVHRLKQLGNSIVPQVAARILWAIREAHEQTTV